MFWHVSISKTFAAFKNVFVLNVKQIFDKAFLKINNNRVLVEVLLFKKRH